MREPSGLTSHQIPRGMLKISWSMTANHCCLALAGTLNRDLAGSLPGLLEQLAARSDGILIDLGDLAEIDEAGISALTRCMEVCRARQVPMSTSGIKGAVRHSIHASGCAGRPPFARA
jgi:anti-anti-sigma regulatory factor